MKGAPAGFDEELLAASHELTRLQEILADAIAVLSHHFAAIAALQESADGHPLPRDRAVMLETHLNGALTALQFQDLSAQLISHVQGRIAYLRGVTAEPAVSHRSTHRAASPVAQDTVSPGSVDLF